MKNHHNLNSFKTGVSIASGLNHLFYFALNVSFREYEFKKKFILRPFYASLAYQTIHNSVIGSPRLIGSPRQRSRVQDPISTINIHEGGH
jgi:hypothetical protein